MSADSVIVRMYRGLLGDCFLLIINSGGNQSTILVDCGVLQGTPDATPRMQKIVENVYETSGEKLDLVVVTHEHWDHISGFQHAEASFKAHGFDELWMAWTEDPADTDAQELQARFAKGHDKLSALQAAASKGPGAASLSCKLAGFAGPGGTEKDKRGSQLIYDNLRKWSRSPPKYLRPGMSADAPGGLKAYVLGPPRDTKLLLKSLPSSGANKETYFGDEAGPDEQHEAKEQSPFARRHHWKSYWDIQRSKAKNGAESYVRDLYFGSDDRRIDDLHAVEFNRLSIKMDSNTNNTSLVLAFELPDGATMIFAADAQVGNWLSWRDAKFKSQGNAGDKSICGDDLLARAKLYKVGHHGSHNATLRARGLELMIRDDLVALISTDAKFALTQGKGWLMPNPRVSAALKKQTKGRVVRGDQPSDQAKLRSLVREGPGELFVDLLAFGEWPKDHPLSESAKVTRQSGTKKRK